MKPQLRDILLCATLLLTLCGVIAGCTYIVTENNRMYYDTMQQCIASGGSFVPTSAVSSAALCFRR